MTNFFYQFRFYAFYSWQLFLFDYSSMRHSWMILNKFSPKNINFNASKRFYLVKLSKLNYSFHFFIWIDHFYIKNILRHNILQQLVEEQIGPRNNLNAIEMPTKSKNPKDSANFLSHLFLCWLRRLVSIGRQSQLTQDDLFELSEDHKAEAVIHDFEHVWEDEIFKAQEKNRQPKLWRAMLKYFSYKDYIQLMFLFILETVCIYCKPVLLWFFLKLLTESQFSERRGYHIGLTLGVLALANFMEAFSQHHNNLLTRVMGMHLNIGCTGVIHKKVCV